MFNKTINAQFLTTINLDIFLRSIFLMTFGLYKLRKGKEVKIFEDKFLEYLGLEGKGKIVSMYNGRSAIFHALEMIGLGKKDEVIVNGYTCVSVANAVLQTNAKIIYSDIEEKSLSFNYDILLENITPNTKVIIIQHTFGSISGNYKKIIDLAKKNNILIIEDCAHSLGAKNKILGDFAIFSTGRDKVMSTVTGGLLLINNSNYFSKINDVKNSLKLPSIGLSLKNLNYNIVAYKTYLTYNILKIGRAIMYLALKLKLIPLILSKSEKECNFNEFNYKLPNSLAYLGLKELEKLDQYNTHRREIANLYIEKLGHIDKISFTNNNDDRIYFGFSILIEEGWEDLYNYCRKSDIILGKFWSESNIAPKGSNLDNANYKKGSCPIAEEVGNKLLILPNHMNITKKDALKVIKIINNFYGKLHS